jgi:hypothetical protein
VFDEVAERDVVSCYSIIGIYMFSGENHGAGLVTLASQFRLSYCCACSLALLLVDLLLRFALLSCVLPAACAACLHCSLVAVAAALLLVAPANFCSYRRLCCLEMVIRVRVPNICWVPDSMGTGIRIIFYPWVTPVPDSNRDGYGTCIFFSPVGNPILYYRYNSRL